MIKDKKNVAIVGAGLVGSLWACFMAKRGYNVHIFERRSDMRKEDVPAGRSINLAMSTRGWNALEKIGLKEALLKIAIPMHGRIIHQEDGTTDFQAYGKKEQYIYSISRRDLNVALMNNADQNEHIQFHFDHKVSHINYDSNLMFFKNKETTSQINADLIFGTDGAFSVVRYQLQKKPLFNYSQHYLEHAYKELSIPANEDGSHKLEKNALHIWPRENFMLIALPNLDGSFTVTLFLQFKGKTSFENLNTSKEILAFFKQYFPTALEHMPTLLGDFEVNPTSSLVTVKCFPWHYQNTCLMGDAAHAVVPFYGQGMNAGFEDCFVLDALIDQHKDENWFTVFKNFSNKHAQNGHAIADLALRHFIEMRDDCADDAFLLRKKLELYLMENYPEQYKSQYQMVTFSNIPYAQALKIGDKQTIFAEKLAKKYLNEKDWKSISFKTEVENWLKENT